MATAARLIGAWRVAERRAPPRLRVVEDRLPTGRLEAAVTASLDGSRPPAAQIVVRRRGTVLWAACAGPTAPADRFVLASVSKLATATIVVLLAERGALGLDDPVATWLSGLPDRLTPRLLLAHRSGLREYARDKTLARRLNGREPEYPWTRAEVIDAIVRLGPEHAPDAKFGYRNSNYVVAAELAERASGQDFETLLRTLIAGPLGLPGFSCAAGRLATPHLAMLGRNVDLLAATRGVVPTDALGPIWGDGGIASSAHDLARFTEALFGGELVRPETLAAMTGRSSRFGRRAGYGLGVMTNRTRRGVVAGHDGLYFGWSASTGIDDATATTVSVVANLASPKVPAARLATAVRAAI